VFVLEASGLGGLVVKESAALVGRDPTLHGRSDIWKAVLSEDTNPMVGAGFYSFWSPERNRRLSEKYYYSLGEAHNGYIETYLNSGLVGLFLLFAMIASAVSGIKRDVLNGSGLGTLRLGFLISTLMYNITESAFDRLVPVCFVLLFAVTGWSRKGNRSVQKMESKSPQPFVSPRSREKAGSSIIGQRLKCLHFSSLWRPFFACLVFVISFQRTQ
jgi:hypothetical protein